jgi:cytochrome b6-f complex iron-sulfur subunit
VEEHRQAEQEPLSGRRTILRWLIRGFLSLWGLGAGYLGLSFLKAPSAERRPSEKQVRCGSFSSLAVGAARFVRHGAQPLYVVRASETEAVALSAICTHLRCVLEWDQTTRSFLCPCHAGAFDRSGNALSGPPKRPLTQHDVEIRADEIVVRIVGRS